MYELSDKTLRADYHVRDLWIVQGREKRRGHFQAHYPGLHRACLDSIVITICIFVTIIYY
jgi:hypothetical protein